MLRLSRTPRTPDSAFRQRDSSTRWSDCAGRPEGGLAVPVVDCFTFMLQWRSRKIRKGGRATLSIQGSEGIGCSRRSGRNRRGRASWTHYRCIGAGQEEKAVTAQWEAEAAHRAETEQ